MQSLELSFPCISLVLEIVMKEFEKLLGSRRHHRWMDRYAHYNSGTAWPKPVYFYQLRRHTRTLQRVLHR